MFGLLNRLRRCQSGSPAVEIALVAPLFLLILVGIVELGSLLSEIVAVEKGLRAGAMIAARNPTDTLNGATITRIKNVAMYGNPNGAGNPRVEGWTNPATITITPRTETINGLAVTVFRLDAVVPYTPVVPGLFDGMFFFDFTKNFSLRAVHDQGYIGS